MSFQEPNLVSKEVEIMLRKGVIQKVFPKQGQLTSNLFLVSKKHGGNRPLINLKNLNMFIPYQYFKMEGHSWQRGPKHLILRRPCYIAYPLFQILPTCLPTFTPTALFVALILWLSEWSRSIWCVILINDIMYLHMSSLGTLVAEGPSCAFYEHSIKFTELCHIMIMWFFASTLIWYLTHKQRHPAPTKGKRLTHPWKYILTPPAMCPQQLPVLY